MEKRYRLLKDTPISKAGALFLKEKIGDYYCHKNRKVQHIDSYKEDVVENSPEWFEKVEVDLCEGTYYIPSIEEFHVGFEYEIFLEITKPKWIPVKAYIGDNYFRFKEYIDKESVRVKYLDKNDILELGFMDISEVPRVNTSSYFSSKDMKTLIFCEYKTHFCSIEKSVIGQDTETVFSGTIKNKSELKRILNQIDYE
jgi:hypothetical protein